MSVLRAVGAAVLFCAVLALAWLDLVLLAALLGALPGGG
jgi:hypothetical protein